MRMWMVDPKFLCHNHLLGEHRELHTFLGTLKKGISIEGYIRNGLLEVHNLFKRHEELVEEFKKRGYNHNSPLDVSIISLYNKGTVSKDNSLKELYKRCSKCRERIKENIDVYL